MLKGIFRENVTRNGPFVGKKGAVGVFVNERKTSMDNTFKLLKKWEEKLAETHQEMI